MIQLKPDARLTIILPNTNKALAEAIKSATPEQLAVLKEGKDIKTLVASLFQDKITSAKSDQTLLQILQNAPAFKNMGNVSERLASLASSLGSVPGFETKSPRLQQLLQNIASLSSGSLKTRMENSGVFMESKLSQALQTSPTLKETLQNLRNLLSQSPSPAARTLSQNVSQLLSQPFFKELSPGPAAAGELGGALGKIAESLRSLAGSTDILYSAQTAQTAHAIASLTDPSDPQLKPLLSQLYGLLLKSTSEQSNFLLDAIEVFLKPDGASQEKLASFSKELGSLLERGDPLSRAASLLPQLERFSAPGALDVGTVLQQSLGEDLKSHLLGLSEELRNSPHPQASELLEQVERLLSTIDYHQLVSYLNASNSIYFPFAWEMLDEGSLAFKKGKEKKFYCEINLRLKEYGELNLMMALYDEKRLDIQIHTEKPELKELISEQLPQLRGLLTDAGLILQTIRISQKSETSSHEQSGYTQEPCGPDLGFEVKV